MNTFFRFDYFLDKCIIKKYIPKLKVSLLATYQTKLFFITTDTFKYVM